MGSTRGCSVGCDFISLVSRIYISHKKKNEGEGFDLFLVLVNIGIPVTGSDDLDEYVCFRNDADDVETAQSSHQLTEDKKDVALETELETRTPSSSIIGLTFTPVISHFATRATTIVMVIIIFIIIVVIVRVAPLINSQT